MERNKDVDEVDKSLANTVDNRFTITMLRRMPEENSENRNTRIVEDMTLDEGKSPTVQSDIEREWVRLRELQATLNQLMAQLEQERLRVAQEKDELERQRAKAQRTEAQHAESGRPEQEDCQGAIGGLVRQLQNVNLDVKIPRYSEEQIPLKYVEDLDQYFRIKGVRSESRLIILDSILEGRIRIWYKVTKNRIGNYEWFKDEFQKEFYSVPVQLRFKNLWMARSYHSGDGSMQSIFYSQLKETEYFEPRQITKYITKLFSKMRVTPNHI